MLLTEQREVNITGTLIWYYFICKREVWLISHGLEANQDNEYLEIGRIIQESSYKRKNKELDLGNIKVDLISKEEDKVVIGEVKKTSSFIESASMQLAFYLLELEKRGIDAIGYLHFPKEKKKIKIELDDETKTELYKAIKDIENLIKVEKPPAVEKNKYCRKCAYQEFCWA